MNMGMFDFIGCMEHAEKQDEGLVNELLKKLGVKK